MFRFTLLATIMLLGCKPVSRLSTVKAEGDYALSNMPQKTKNAIMQACNDPKGAYEVGITIQECYLIMAGSTVKESSWKFDKSAEAWGQSDNMCYGLTQSRATDAVAVGLPNCANKIGDTDSAGLKCNVLTGLRNLGCLADGGSSCRKWSGTLSLRTGITKHLGSPNQANLSPYTNVMREIYQRSDVRSHFGINAGELRNWNELLDAPYQPGAFGSEPPADKISDDDKSGYQSPEDFTDIPDSGGFDNTLQPPQNSGGQCANGCVGIFSGRCYENGASVMAYTCQGGQWKMSWLN